jgi:hypothetical protein
MTLYLAISILWKDHNRQTLPYINVQCKRKCLKSLNTHILPCMHIWIIKEKWKKIIHMFCKGKKWFFLAWHPLGLWGLCPCSLWTIGRVVTMDSAIRSMEWTLVDRRKRGLGGLHCGFHVGFTCYGYWWIPLRQIGLCPTALKNLEVVRYFETQFWWE